MGDRGLVANPFQKNTAVLSVLELHILKKTSLEAGRVCCGEPHFMKYKKAVTCYVCQESFSNGILCFYTYWPCRITSICVWVHAYGFNKLINPKNV
jgi:hypothetical protein